MTKKEILNFVRDWTGRGDSIKSIDIELISTLRDVTIQYPFLKKKTTIATPPKSNSSILPKECIEVIQIYDNEGRVLDSTEFLFLPKQKVYGKPFLWAVDNNVIFWYKTPDKEYTFDMYYSYVHPSDLDDILLNDRLLEVVQHGVLSRNYERRNEIDNAVYHKSIYERLLLKMATILIKEPIRIVREWR